jgi:lysophospholipase L1-like esterase
MLRLFRFFSPLLLLGTLFLLTACGPISAGGAATSTPAPTPAPTEPALASALPGSYAALGASETYGVGATPHTRGYAFQVAQQLQARHFLDLGIPGTTLDAGYDTELTRALDIRPSFCTVFFGVNDLRAGITRQSFIQELYDLVASLRRAHAQVLIIGIPDLSLLPAVAQLHVGDLHQIITSWNAGMREVSNRTGAHFLDLSAFTRELAAHPNYVAADGLHPSNAGHARLAQVVLATVKQEHLWTVP